MWKNKSLREVENNVTALSKLTHCWGNCSACEPKWDHFFANPREKEARCALKQQEGYFGRQVQDHLPKAGQSRQDAAEQALPSLCGRRILTALQTVPGRGTEERFCTSIWQSAAAMEITVVKHLTGFKAVICKKAISLLLVLGFSLLSQNRSKNSLIFIGVYFLVPASLPVLPINSATASEPIHFASVVACSLEEP